MPNPETYIHPIDVKDRSNAPFRLAIKRLGQLASDLRNPALLDAAGVNTAYGPLNPSDLTPSNESLKRREQVKIDEMNHGPALLGSRAQG